MLRLTSPLFRWRIETVAVVLGIALVTSSCAGQVGKYRDVAGDGARGVGNLAGPEGAEGDIGLEGSEDTAALGEGSGSGAAGSAVSGGSDAADPSGGSDASTSARTRRASAGTGGPSPGVTPTQVTVGLFYPASGPVSVATRNWPDAVRGAFDEVNDKGGIHGRKLVLRTYDAGDGNASSINAHHRRARNEAFVYLASENTTTDVLAPMAQQDRVPFVAGNLDSHLRRTLDYTFPVYTSLDRQAGALPGFIINRMKAGNKKIGVVYETGPGVRRAKAVFDVVARRAGLTVVDEHTVDRTPASCVNQTSSMQRKGVEVVVLMTATFGATCVMRDARTVRFSPKWTGIASLMQVNLTATASGGSADGLTLPGTWTTLETKAGQRYQSSMRKRYPNGNVHTDDIALILYAAALPLIEGLRHAGRDLTRERFMQAMETKLAGFTSGFLPPPAFSPSDHMGPRGLDLVSCCKNDRFYTVDPTWREKF